MLVLIAANKANFKLSESRAAMNTIRRYAADDAHVIFGAAYDDSLGDQLRVTVIATGLSRGARQQTPPLTVVQPTAQPALRTGTDNLPILNQVLAMLQPGGTGQAQQPDDGNLGTPSVWRTNRHQAAAKVQALSSNRMDEIEIPAFLRNQADRQLHRLPGADRMRAARQHLGAPRWWPTFCVALLSRPLPRRWRRSQGRSGIELLKRKLPYSGGAVADSQRCSKSTASRVMVPAVSVAISRTS